MKKLKEDPTKVCIKCGSKNVVTTQDSLEKDTKCKDCGDRHGVIDFRIMLGFTKKQCKEMDKERSKRK